MKKYLEIAGKILDIFKMIPIKRALVVIIIVCGYYLYIPEAYDYVPGSEIIRSKIGDYLGVIMFVAIVMLFVEVSVMTWRWIMLLVDMLMKEPREKKLLTRQSDWAKSIILQMYKSSTRAQKLPLQDANVMAMMSDQIISLSQMGDVVGFECILNPWVVEYLDKHPEFVASIQPFDTPYQLYMY